MKPILLTLLVVGAALAGCSGQSGEPRAAVNLTNDAAEFSEVTGALAGVVVDEEQLPISGALVTIRERKLIAKSGDDGRFFLNLVPPGEHQVFAVAAGFEPVSMPVVVRAGEATQGVAFALVALPLGVPYYETVNKAAIVTSTSAFSGGPDANVNFTIEGAGLMNLLFEADWEPQSTAKGLQNYWRDLNWTSNTGPGLYLFYQGYPSWNIWMNPGKKGPGADLRFNGNQDFTYAVLWRCFPYEVTEPNSFLDNFSVVLDQRIENYITLFYYEPGTPDFSALPRDG